jgi:DNA damage-inducible protein 1
VGTDVQLSSDLINLDVPSEMTLTDIKGLIESELDVSPVAQELSRDGQPLLDNSKSLEQLEMKDGDLLGLRVRSRQQNSQSRAQTSAQSNPDAERIRLHMLGDARFMERVRQENPRLADAATDSVRFQTAWQEEHRRIRAQQEEQERQYELLEDDPFNTDAQQKIEKLIQQQQIAINIEKAMEENPESFARVSMLYIDVTVNNVPIKAFVDSGAQTTIMSPDAAARCNITHLIDKRWGGMARGVGTAKILGRVHHAYIQIGQYQAASSFTVMEGKDVDLLLGLDMLKKHQMCIDLSKNALRVQEDEIQFLPEHEIPKMLEEALENEPKVTGPGGATIGAKTGTVEAPQQAQSTSSASAGPSSTQQVPPPTQNVAPAPAAFGQARPITEQSIRQVMEMGFSRENAIMALQQAQGNVELAAGILMGFD